jgi:polysaccharide biosynthesis transport protein
MQDQSENSSNRQVIVPRGASHGATRVLYLEPVSSDTFSEGDHSSLVKHWQVVRRKLPWIVAMVFIGSLLGFAWSRWQKPVYQAHVTLEIENPSENAFNLRSSDLQVEGALSPAESYLPTQILILQSRTLRMRAGAKFGAHQYPVKVKIRVEPNSRIVQIICDSSDAKFAADYANAMANEYIESDLQAHWDAFHRTREWLAHQQEETRAKLQQSETDLQEYARASNLIFTGHETDDKEKLRQIEGQVVQAQAERVQRQSVYQIAASSPADWLPQVMDNPSLSEYKSQLASLRKQIAELLPEYTPEHYKIKRLQAQIDEIQATFQQERANVMARIRSDYQSALAREKLLTAAYQKQAQVVSMQTQKAINYNILEREADTNRQLYASLLQRSKEADATAMRGSNVRIVDSAEPPLTSYAPSFRNNTLMGAVSGLLLGMGLVLAFESFDRSFRSPGDLSFHLRLPELGVIPAGNMLSGNGHAMPWRKSVFPSLAASAERRGGQSIELATWRDKSSIIAESFRNALTSIQCSPQGARPRVILVTSAIRGEGKTTIVSNLGIALAEINQRVLLIDGDMRKPRLNSVFNVPNDWGLSDILREKNSLRDCPLEAFVKRTEMEDLAILTSGPGTNNIANLLYSHRMLELLQRLRGEFDAILIDTPPMLDISDARILGRLADAVILVFRAGETSRDAALAAKRRLTEDGITVLGTILNAWDSKHMSGYGASHYYQTNLSNCRS